MAFAVMSEFWRASENWIVGMNDSPDPYAGVPALAQRLGVPEFKGGTSPLLVSTKDGRHYDVLALVNAFLDRIDATITAAMENQNTNPS